MILRNFTLPFRAASIPSFASQQCVRNLHSSLQMRPVPEPTPFVPDPATFLKLIGRGLSQYASKFESWEALFSLSSAQMRELGIEPPRARKYLLRWRERFRNGAFGPGGNVAIAKDGVAYFKVVERRSATASKVAKASLAPGKVRMAVNVPEDKLAPDVPVPNAPTVPGYKVRNLQTLTGSHLQIVPGTGARIGKIEAAEGLWEMKRGVKLDGGERRRVYVRSQRRLAEAKARREAAPQV